MNKITIALGIFLFSGVAIADEANWYLGADLGQVNVKLKPSFTIAEQSFSETNLELGLNGGIQFASKFMLEMKYLISDSTDVLDLEDTYNFDQVQLLTGFTIELNDYFYFIPKAGFSFWGIDSEEGQLFNPGNEATNSKSGTDFIWSLNLEYRINDLIQLELSYADNSYDFGSAESTNLGIKFEF